ncbi:MAG: hypothetical protein KGS09_19660, partial [Nitrospirae bacterium]|nr:hypothetical protein [Nitrospirota bacterium]
MLIREAMVAHGPDGAGLWVSSDERIGLAYRQARVPFVDVEPFRALHPLRMLTSPPTKALLAATQRHPLPHKILRKKTGFGIHVREWAPMDHSL